jgi:hypothetical protein
LSFFGFLIKIIKKNLQIFVPIIHPIVKELQPIDKYHIDICHGAKEVELRAIRIVHDLY